MVATPPQLGFEAQPSGNGDDCPPNRGELVPQLLGRVGESTPSSYIQWHFFGSFSILANTISPYIEIPNARQPSVTTPPGCKPTERLWLITTYGRSLTRQQTNGPVPVLTQPSSQISGDGTQLGGTRRTLMRLRVQTGGDYGPRDFFMDAGGPPVAVSAQSVIISPWGPQTYVEVLPDDIGVLTAGTDVSDELVNVSIQAIEESRGCRATVLTEFINVPANTATPVPVPRYAVDVQISQNAIGAPSARWLQFVGFPTTGIASGSVRFVPGGRTTDIVNLGSEISYLQTDQFVPAARLFTLRWTIRP